MTVLQIIQEAAPFVGVAVPPQVFGSTEREHLELGTIANEAAGDILDEHNWRALAVRREITGDGTATAFALPTDFHRVAHDMKIRSNGWERPWVRVPTLDEFNLYEVRDYKLVDRYWVIAGGEIRTLEPLPNGEVSAYYYQSKNYADLTGSYTSTFNNDEQLFRLDDRLLKLAIIWRWRALKRLDYAEDISNYQKALETAVSRDGGPRVISVGGKGMRGAEETYPGTITA